MIQREHALQVVEPSIHVMSVKPMTGTEVVYCKAPQGMSIAEMLWDNLPNQNDLPYTLSVWVDGKQVSAELLDSTYPTSGQIVVIRPTPKKGALRIILMIVVIILAAYIAPYISGYLISSLALTTVPSYGTIAGIVSVAGMLAINALIPPETPKLRGGTASADIQESPTLWVSGARNSANKWGSVPVILGKHRTIPFYGAMPYTEIVGNDQYLRCVFVIGYGPLQITDLKIGETPLSEFPDCEVEVRSGYANDDPLTLVPSDVYEESLAILLKKIDGWQTRVTQINSDEFSIDYAFLQGLTNFNTQGNKYERTVALDLRYRKVGTETWFSAGEVFDVAEQNFTVQSSWDYVIDSESGVGGNYPKQRFDYVVVEKINGRVKISQDEVPSDSYPLAKLVVYGSTIESVTDQRPGEISGMLVTKTGDLTVNVASGTVTYVPRLTITAASAEAVRGSIIIRLPEKGQYEVQMRRITDDTESQYTRDQCTWITLRSVKDVYPFNFPHPLALVAIRIKATEQLSRVIDEFNCVATSIILDYDEDLEEWVQRPSNNNASLYRHVLQGPANGKPYEDSSLDLDWFKEFWEFCYENGFSYNSVISQARAVPEMIRAICSAGRCSPQRREDKWAGVIDREQAVITGHYTPHNSWGFEFEGSYPELPHAIKVNFLDAENDWNQAERIVYADGYNEDNATLFETATQEGITFASHIYKIWRYNYACAMLRPFPFSFFVDWENLTNTRGDLVRCTYYELIGQVFTGRIKKVEVDSGNHVLTLDNSVIMEAGRSYGIRIRVVDDGTQKAHSVTGDVILSVGETTIITIDGLLAKTPHAGELFQLGEMGIESIPAIITHIEALSKLSARITCLDYSPAVFTADQGPIPPWDPVFNQTPLASVLPPIPIIISSVSDESVMIREPGGRDKYQIAIHYRIPSSAQVQANEVQGRYYRMVEGGGKTWATLEPVPASSGTLLIPDVEQDGEYQIQLRSISVRGARSNWCSEYYVKVVGSTTPTVSVPVGLDLSTGVAMGADGSEYSWIRATWTPNEEDFLSHYEYRIKETGGNYIYGFVTANEILFSPVRANILHYVGIRAIDIYSKKSAFCNDESITSARDVTPPGVPTDLAATPGIKLITLTWTNPADKDLSHINIYRSNDSTRDNAVLIGKSRSTSYTDNLNAGGVTRYYWISSEDLSGNVSTTEAGPVHATTTYVEDWDTTPPGTPTGLSLSTGVAMGADGSEYAWIRATWTANEEADLSHYEYRIKETGGNYIYGFVTANQILFSPVRANILHYVGVKAIDIYSNKSGFTSDSSITSASDTTAPATPTGLTLIAGFKLIGLKWNQNTEADLDSYVIQRSHTGAFGGETVNLGPAYTHFFVDTDLLVATQYWYRICARDSSGNTSSWTASVSATTLQVGQGEIVASTALINELFANTALVNALIVQLNNLTSTKILPGLIEISGGTSLADWRHGSDSTKIDGGDIYANSITANKLTIGSRNLSIQGIEISAQTPTANTLYWTAGVISYVKDDGTTADVNISANNVAWSSGTLYLYWVKDATALSTTTDRATAFGASNIVMASYRGGTDLVVNYGRTIIDGSDIVAGTITGTTLAASNIITSSAQMGAAVIGTAQITDLSVNTLKVANHNITRMAYYSNDAGIEISNTTETEIGSVSINASLDTDSIWVQGRCLMIQNPFGWGKEGCLVPKAIRFRIRAETLTGTILDQATLHGTKYYYGYTLYGEVLFPPILLMVIKGNAGAGTRTYKFSVQILDNDPTIGQSAKISLRRMTAIARSK